MALHINQIPGAILRLDPEGRIIELNRTCRELDDCLAEEQSLPECLDPVGRAELAFCLRDDSRTEPDCWEFEACIGDRRFRLAVAGSVCAQGSRVVQLTDITEYRTLSERTAINEQRFRSLFERNPDALCSLDLQGRLVETNQATEYLTGYNEGELYCYHWASLVDKRDQDAARETFEAALAGHPCSYRCKVRNRNGERAVVEVTYIPILIGGEVTGVFGVARDKTERYRLEESRRLLHACLAQVQDVIIITETAPLDHPGPRIVYVNGGVERMTGYSPDELLGETPRIFQGPDTNRAALSRIRSALEAKAPVKEELVNYCKDGHPFWNEIEIVPIPSAGAGGRPYFASVQRDITQTKQREAELRRSREELRRLNQVQEGMLEQERRRIARDLHDELGQTLTALKLNLGIAVSDREDLPPDHVRRLEDIIGFVDGAVEKVREISSNLRPPILDDLGFEAAAEWFLNSWSQVSGLTVRWDPEPSGVGRLKGDKATGLFRILQECMTNVTRHSAASMVTISYRENDDRVSMEIRDNGKGFDPGQVRPSGFGLVGIRERVSAMDGDLTVESAIGKGVRIHVELPMEDAI